MKRVIASNFEDILSQTLKMRSGDEGISWLAKQLIQTQHTNTHTAKQSHGKIFYVFTVLIPMPINHIAVEISLFGLLSFSDTSIATLNCSISNGLLSKRQVCFLCLSQETNLDIWFVTSLALSLFHSFSLCLAFVCNLN